MPIFDPTDTWASLRERSPFAVTALILVGAQIEDAGKEPSELQRKCKEHAENMGELPVPEVADSRNAHAVHPRRAH